MRITLGGGGTDLPSYSSRRGGFVIAAGIDRYCSIVATPRFYDTIRLSYSQMEIRDSIDEIEHRIFREALRFSNITSRIELHSVADVPANAGLGSSSSFTVALLNALHAYRREFVSHEQLAEEACHIEIDVLGEPIGRQDQYMAAFGGITCLTFDKGGGVLVEPLRVSEEVVEQLENNLSYFFTGKERSASEILADQDARSRDDDKEMLRNLDEVKEIGLASRKCLEDGKIDEFGELLDRHWQIKKARSARMTDPFLDECYAEARQKGALGGKIMGAGGGGFFMFYSRPGDKGRLGEAMKKLGLRQERFHFDFEGAKILVNMKRM